MTRKQWRGAFERGGKGKRWHVWAIVSANAVSYQLLNRRSARRRKRCLAAAKAPYSATATLRTIRYARWYASASTLLGARETQVLRA